MSQTDDTDATVIPFPVIAAHGMRVAPRLTLITGSKVLARELAATLGKADPHSLWLQFDTAAEIVGNIVHFTDHDRAATWPSQIFITSALHPAQLLKAICQAGVVGRVGQIRHIAISIP